MALVLAGSPVFASGTPQPAIVPIWDLKVGFSYLSTTGNTDTSSGGFDANFNREGKVWAVEGTAAAVSATKRDKNTAESYNAQVRARRKARKFRQWTAGLRAERNRFAGLDYRAGADVSLLWDVRDKPGFKVRVLTGLSLSREEPRGDRPVTDTFGGLLQVSSDGRLSETATWEGQVTFFPSFDDPDDYRVNGRLGLQAALNRHLGVRLGYDLKYDHEPVQGFDSTDTTTTASLVLQLGRKARL